jgi:hypothetical protein
MTKTRPGPLLALLIAAAACGRPQAGSEAVGEERGGALDRPIAQVQANAAKPLIHVWKSPT